MDRLEAAGDPELRETLRVVRGSAVALTADDLADAVGVHRNVARSRLERLAAAGLLETSFERRSGRTGPGAGRPAKTYAAAPELRAIEFPERRYEQLVGLLLELLPARGLREAGHAFGRRLAREARLRPSKRRRAGLERVCAAVRELGFQASLESVSDEEAVIATPTCPLRPLVRARPDAVELDRGMWAGLVASALDGVEPRDVRCETHECADDHASCRVVVKLGPTPSR